MPDWRGRYLWYELLTTDPTAAQDFYTKLIGWGLETSTAAGMSYTMWTRAGTPIGGVLDLPAAARSAGAPPHWLAYIGTHDVDATAAQAQRQGGRVIVPPQDVPTQGRFAVLTDPDGVLFALWKPLREPGPP